MQLLIDKHPLTPEQRAGLGPQRRYEKRQAIDVVARLKRVVEAKGQGR